jgi:hypothetical protein
MGLWALPSSLFTLRAATGMDPVYVACPRSSCSRLEEAGDVNWWHTPPALLTLQDPVDFQYVLLQVTEENKMLKKVQLCACRSNYHTVQTIYISFFLSFLLWRCDPARVMASSFLRFLDHTQRRTTVGRTSLNERSARSETST